MLFVFYKTNDVFLAEERLQENGVQVDIVPTPVQDKAYCGVCVQVNASDADKAKPILVDMDYQMIQ